MKKILILIFVLAQVLLSKDFSRQNQNCSFRYEGVHSVSPIKMDLLLGGGKGCDVQRVRERLSYLPFVKEYSVSRTGDTLSVMVKEKPTISVFILKGFEISDEEFIKKNILKRNHYIDEKYAYGLKKSVEAYLEQTGRLSSDVEVRQEIINEGSVRLLLTLRHSRLLTVKGVSFPGVPKSLWPELKENLKTKEEESFSWIYGRSDGSFIPSEVQKDLVRIKEFFLERGYIDVQVLKPKMKTESDSVYLDFPVVCGERYSIEKYGLEFGEQHRGEAYKRVSEAIGDIIKQQPKKSFNIKKVRALVKDIKGTVQNFGFFNASVVPNIEKRTSFVDINIRVVLGESFLVNNVYIGGNNKTLDRVVRRGVFLRPGDIYSKKEVKESENALRRTGYFENVEITEKVIGKDRLDLVVKVKEAKTGNLMVGGGYGSQTGFVANLSVAERNFLGYSMGVGAYASISEVSKAYNLNLENPAINDGDFSMGVNLYKNQYEAGEDELQIQRDEIGISMSIGYRWNRYLRFNAGLGYEELEEEYVNLEQRNDYNKRVVSGALMFNNTDGFFFPRQGFIVSDKIEYAGFGGTLNYWKNNLSYRYFKDLEGLVGYDALFRHRVGVGYLDYLEGSSTLDGYTLGGISTVRGYENYAFGLVGLDGNVYDRRLTNSFELSLKIGNSTKVRGGLFYDVGGIGRGKFGGIVKQSYGAMLEWYSPIGPIQFVLASPINPDPADRTSVFEFSIGQQF